MPPRSPTPPIRTPDTQWYTVPPGIRVLDHPSPRNIERLDLACLPYIDACHQNGIYLDTAELGRLGVTLDQRLGEIAARITAHVGRPVNPESPDQVRALLFDEMGLHSRLEPAQAQALPKTPGGRLGKPQYSTSDEVLKTLLHLDPVVQMISDSRQVSTLLGTFVRALPRMVDSGSRVHTTFKYTTARTGRLASENPNLQNIPTRSELGALVRKCFKAYSPQARAKGIGRLVLVSLDLSQIEMRLAAHMSQDQAMCTVFWDGLDMHEQTARAIFRVPAGVAVDKKTQRLPAKTLGFGILYGVQAAGLQGQIFSAGGPFWSIEECDRLIREWFRAYPGVQAWMDLQASRARRYGMVWDMFGRIRPIPEIRSVHDRVQAKGLREGGNMPIQGGAQGVIKLGMARVMLESVVERYHRSGWCLPLLQIHDELLFEMAESQAEDFVAEVRGILRGAVRLVVPLESSGDMAEDWGSLK